MSGVSVNNAWKADIVRKLAQRDSREKSKTGVFTSFTFMHQRLNELETKLSILEISEEKRDTVKLLNDLETTKQLLADRETELASMTIDRDKFASTVAELEKSVSILKDGYRNMQEKASRTQEEKRIITENLETVNDTLLSLQIENNLLNERVASLTRENEQLVKRWMDRIAKDVEVLNDANDILEQSKRSLTPK